MIYTCAKIKCEGGVNNFQSVVIFYSCSNAPEVKVVQCKAFVLNDFTQTSAFFPLYVQSLCLSSVTRQYTCTNKTKESCQSIQEWCCNHTVVVQLQLSQFIVFRDLSACSKSMNRLAGKALLASDCQTCIYNYEQTTESNRTIIIEISHANVQWSCRMK